MKQIINIVLIGPMGAGKTTIGKMLAQKLNWDFYDSDQVIEERAGVDLLWIYDVEGEQGFQRREQRVIAELVTKSKIVLATGGNTIVTTDNCRAIAANSLVVYLKSSLDEQVLRTSYSKKRPLALEREKRRKKLQQLRQEQGQLYESLADIVYATTHQTAHTIAAELMKKCQTLTAPHIFSNN